MTLQTQVTADVVAQAADDLECLVTQMLFHALTHGVSTDAVLCLLAYVAEGASPSAAVVQVMDDMGLPQPVRLH